MAKDTGIVQADPLFIGLTRPPLTFGVGTMWLALESVVTMLAYVFDPSIKYLLGAVFVHFIGMYLYGKEPLFLELFNTKYSKCGPRFNTYLCHGKNSYDPY